jgi:hypothetical protein
MMQLSRRILIVWLVGISVTMSLVAGVCRSDSKRGLSMAKAKTRVVLTPLYLRYFEDTDFLELNVELLVGGTYVVFLPSPERWRRTMPPWAAQRREQIIAEIKRLTRREKIEWRVVD